MEIISDFDHRLTMKHGEKSWFNHRLAAKHGETYQTNWKFGCLLIGDLIVN